jgi:hypothetical protein
MKCDHKLSDMVEKRMDLEKAITSLIRRFESDTGLIVIEIEIGRMYNVILGNTPIQDTLTVAKVVVVL